MSSPPSRLNVVITLRVMRVTRSVTTTIHFPMLARWLISIVVLPGTVLVVVPLLILWLASRFGIPYTIAHPATIPFWLGLIVAIPGGLFSIWSMLMFLHFGDGTPAPWDPPKRFVARGPYRHVRNPMIFGVVLLLFAEALFLQSWPLACWGAVFFAGNSLYFPLVEEPGLRERFGAEYNDYCQNVGRWVPRITPWERS